MNKSDKDLRSLAPCQLDTESVVGSGSSQQGRVLSRSTHRYSLEANKVEHTCECCQELQTSQRNVTLRCDDGSSRTFSYTQVEKCGCLGQQCHALGDTSHAESSEQESKESEEHGQQSAFRVSKDMLGPFQ